MPVLQNQTSNSSTNQGSTNAAQNQTNNVSANQSSTQALAQNQAANALTNPITNTAGGNLIVSSEHFQVGMLTNIRDIIIYQPDSTLMVLEQRATKARVTILQTEEDADNLLSSNSLTRVINESNTREDGIILELNDLMELLEFDTQEVLFEFVSAFENLRVDTDSSRFLKLILELKQTYDVRYILTQLERFSESEMEELLESYTPTYTFREIMDDHEDD